MTIVHVITSLNRSDGGPPKSCIDLAIQTQEQGVKVMVVYDENLQDPYEQFTQVLTLKIKFYQVHSFLKNRKDVVLHLHGLWRPYILNWVLIAKLLGIKTILSVRGMLEPWSLSQGRLKKKLALFFYQKWILNSVNYVHATSDEEVLSIKRVATSSKIVNIPNSINVGQYKRTINYRKTGKIGFISRIHPKKGLDYLIRSLSQTKYTLDIYGSGDKTYIEKLKYLAKLHDVEDRVRFLGFLDDKTKLTRLQEFEILTLPTHSENFGVIIAEAMAMEVPVITTQNTPWKLLNQWNAGFCISLEDSKLKEALVEMENKNEQELAEMGRAGRRVVESSFDIRLVSIIFKDLYESC